MGSTTWTEQQLREFEIRTKGNGSLILELKQNIPQITDESALHNAIIDYCKSKGWQYLHGSMAHRSRRTIGENDFTILADGGRIYLIECKSKTGKLSPEQQAFKAHAAKNGHFVWVIRSMDDFRGLVE